jgi:hypothetical protein
MRVEGSAVGAPEQLAAVSVSYQLVLEGASGGMTPVEPAPAVPLGELPAPPDDAALPVPAPGPLTSPVAVHAEFDAAPNSIAIEQATPNGRSPRKRARLDFMFTSSTRALD